MVFEIKEDRIIFGNKDIAYQDILEGIGALSNDIVYLAGSLVEGRVDKYSKGIGNPYSDVDVFIIRGHQEFENTVAEYVEDVKKTYFRNINGTSLDIEVFDGKYVCDLRDSLIDLTICKDIRLPNILKQTLQKGHDLLHVNEFLNRLTNSICIFNEVHYRKIRSSINFEAFLKLKAYHLITIIDNNMSDIKGNLISKQPDVALFSIREAMMNLMEAILAYEGIFVDRHKWVALKFTNLVRVSGEYASAYKLYIDKRESAVKIKQKTNGKICDKLEICENHTNLSSYIVPFVHIMIAH